MSINLRSGLRGKMLRRRTVQTKSGTSRRAVQTSPLTIQYGGLEQTIQLPLSNEEIGKLALQADVRDVSVGQLVRMLLEDAMAQDLSRVLDKKPAEEPE